MSSASRGPVVIDTGVFGAPLTPAGGLLAKCEDLTRAGPVWAVYRQGGPCCLRRRGSLLARPDDVEHLRPVSHWAVWPRRKLG